MNAQNVKRPISEERVESVIKIYNDCSRETFGDRSFDLNKTQHGKSTHHHRSEFRENCNYADSSVNITN